MNVEGSVFWRERCPAFAAGECCAVDEPSFRVDSASLPNRAVDSRTTPSYIAAETLIPLCGWDHTSMQVSHYRVLGHLGGGGIGVGEFTEGKQNAQATF